MAVGNAIVQTAKFKPLSYNEWAAPLRELNQQHAATEQLLLGLQDEANNYQQYINLNPDSPLSQKYNNYIDNIDRIANQLVSEGITPQTRTDLLNLKRDYANVVKPITQGLNAYQQAANKRSKDAAKGIIGNTLTPEKYITNPDYIDNYTTIDDVAKDAANIFNGLKGYEARPQIQRLEDGSTVMVTPQSYSQEDFEKAFNNDADASPELTAAVNALRQKYAGYATDNDTRNLIEGSLRMAANSAIKQPKYSGRRMPKSATSSKTTSSTKTGKSSLVYQGVVSARTPHRDLTNLKQNQEEPRSATVNKIDAKLPANSKKISAQEAQEQYPNLFNQLFSNAKVNGMELSKNADLYDFYIGYDNSLYELNPNAVNFGGTNVTPTLYIMPRTSSGPVIDMNNVDVSNIF